MNLAKSLAIGLGIVFVAFAIATYLIPDAGVDPRLWAMKPIAYTVFVLVGVPSVYGLWSLGNLK